MPTTLPYPGPNRHHGAIQRLPSNELAWAVAEMLHRHVHRWPEPAAHVRWRNQAKFTVSLIIHLCPVISGDPDALPRLVAPLILETPYNRYVADPKLPRSTWSASFGEAIVAQVLQVVVASIVRIGERFEEAAAASGGEAPEPEQIPPSHPMDKYVIGAMAGEGVLDYRRVAAAPGAKRGSREPKRHDRGAPATVKLVWLGRTEPQLWNYVQAQPRGTTIEQVAAALYGDPGQSRMAYAIRKHGDVYQIAPEEARQLIATRYPGEVVGQGTARDGAALAASRFGDDVALTQASADSVAALPPNAHGAVSEAQMRTLHGQIAGRLLALAGDAGPSGLAWMLAPAYAFRARTEAQVLQAGDAHGAAGAGGALRAKWFPVWHAQHVHLITIAEAVHSLVQSATQTGSSPVVSRVDRDQLAHYLKAAAASHLHETCGSILADIRSDKRQVEIDAATQALIALHEDTQRANATRGQRNVTGNAEADADLDLARDRLVVDAARDHMVVDARRRRETSASRSEAEHAVIRANEISLQTRIDTVEIALADLSSRVEDAGAGLSDIVAKQFSGRFRHLPEVIDAIRQKLSEVNYVWAYANHEVERPDVIEHEGDDERADWYARQKGLAAAEQAFAKIAGDRDLATFFREAQELIGHQELRSGIVRLAGAIAITVGTAGAASELGAAAASSIAGTVGDATTVGATAVRAGAVVTNITINVTINSAVQYAMAEGHESLGWAMVENTLAEVATRGMSKLLEGPLTQMQKLEQKAAQNARRLSELNALRKRGAVMTEAQVAERAQLTGAGADRAAWFVINLSSEAVIGMASQWAGRQLVSWARNTQAQVDDDYAMTVLQQGACIALGKKLHGLKAAWQKRRTQLAAHRGFTQIPDAQHLVSRREQFFRDADALQQSLSPDPAAAERLVDEHQALVDLEHKVVAQLGSGDGATIATSDAPPHTAPGPTATMGSPDGTSRRSTPPSRESAEAPHSDREHAPQAASTTMPSPDSHEQIFLAGDDNLLRDAARRVRPLAGYIDVIVHADADRFWVVRDAEDIALDHRALATYVRKHGLQGQKIRLIACEAGMWPNAVAQHLANKLHQEVLAPTMTAWIDGQGNVGVGGRNQHQGKWETFRSKPSSADAANAILQIPEEPSAPVDPSAPEHVPPLQVRFDYRERYHASRHDELQAVLGRPLHVNPNMVDGVRMIVQRERGVFGTEYHVRSIAIGAQTRTADIWAHAELVRLVERYNGFLGRLRKIWERLRGKAGPRYPHGSRGWVLAVEIEKVGKHIEATQIMQNTGLLDAELAAAEVGYLQGVEAYFREELRDLEAFNPDHAQGHDELFELSRPDVGQATREAEAAGYKRPGQDGHPIDGVTIDPDWYYYRRSKADPSVFELVRKPDAPPEAPQLQARVVGHRFVAIEAPSKEAALQLAHIPAGKELETLYKPEGSMAPYAAMLERTGLATKNVIDGAALILHRQLAERPNATIDTWRHAVKDYFRQRVLDKLLDPMLDAGASYQQMREMLDGLGNADRGTLVEAWYVPGTIRVRGAKSRTTSSELRGATRARRNAASPTASTRGPSSKSKMARIRSTPSSLVLTSTG